MIAEQFSHSAPPELIKLVALDHQLVRQLGIVEVADLCPNRYWRAQAITAAFLLGDKTEARLRRKYPAEWLWAVAMANDTSSLSEVTALLRRHKRDPDIVNRVLLCAESLRDGTLAQEAIRYAERLVAGADRADELS